MTTVTGLVSRGLLGLRGGLEWFLLSGATGIPFALIWLGYLVGAAVVEGTLFSTLIALALYILAALSYTGVQGQRVKNKQLKSNKDSDSVYTLRNWLEFPGSLLILVSMATMLFRPVDSRDIAVVVDPFGNGYATRSFIVPHVPFWHTMQTWDTQYQVNIAPVLSTSDGRRVVVETRVELSVEDSENSILGLQRRYGSQGAYLALLDAAVSAQLQKLVAERDLDQLLASRLELEQIAGQTTQLEEQLGAHWTGAYEITDIHAYAPNTP